VGVDGYACKSSRGEGERVFNGRRRADKASLCTLGQSVHAVDTRVRTDVGAEEGAM
jgi:hypothetical protein